jgi:hypothetical protein
MQPSELPIEYACRLKKWFYLAFPLTENKASTDTMNKLEEVLKDKFVEGLPLEIRHKVRDKTFKTFDELVKFTGRKASNFEDEKKYKEERRRIAMIHSEYTLQEQPSIALVQVISTLTSELQNMKNQVAVIQQRNDGPSQRHLMGQAAHLKNLEGGQQGVAYNRQSGYMGGNRNNNQGGSQQGLNRSGTRYNPGQY